MKIKLKSNQFTFVLITLFSISIVLNIYLLSKVNRYNYSVGRESYNYIEEIRQRNEGVMEILNKGIENGSIRNEEMLKLYKNYDVISGNIIKLWQKYVEYTDRSVWIFTKRVECNNIIENDIHGKVKEYMLSTLNKEMKNEEVKLILEGKDLECFKEMEHMSIRIYDYFNEFNENIFKGDSINNREEIILERHYWIDMLNEIHEISSDYIDVEWNIEAEEQLTVDSDV